ncbi:Gfo/Idh/MocA family oxidoreductase [bacterium]|nr:Gfo/Idh/MocA family oxidoreductase [bacterium]
MSEETRFTRRGFIGAMAAAGTVALACSKTKKPEGLPPMLETAPDGPVLKAGLVGCGGRGTGAAVNFLEAGPSLAVTALGDVFADRLNSARAKIEEKSGKTIADEHCFVGFDAFEKVIGSGVDVVILATPPHFRPEHFAAAVNARKHVFMEKPVCVDPVGARSIMESAERAEAFGLSVVTGTQRRHERSYVETYKQIAGGAIGDIVSAACYWNGGQLWYELRKPGWTEMEWMIRDWVNWCWLSGDHIVEQHVHNIDVINWFTGAHPVKALGFGSRQRRVTGDQYDFFSVDFVLDDGRHFHSMCRQINGCTNSVSEFVQGTRGSSDCHSTIYKRDGSAAWKFTPRTRLNDEGEEVSGEKSPYVQEHTDLVTAIRTGVPINEAKNTAISTLAAVMGRISAYTGREVTWEEMMNSDLRLGPASYRLGSVNMPAVVPIPGSE